MKIIDSLRRSLSRLASISFFSCKRITPDSHPILPSPLPAPPPPVLPQQHHTESSDVKPARHSNSMLVGTLFGSRSGRVSFCLQATRASSRPYLLVDLPISPHHLAQEMQSCVLRLALECDARKEGYASCPLRSVPSWSAFCNGHSIGTSSPREPTFQDRAFLKAMQSTSAGAGVFRDDQGEEILYMRSCFERVIGSSDSESFHLINPQGSPGQELSLFLIRSR